MVRVPGLASLRRRLAAGALPLVVTSVLFLAAQTAALGHSDLDGHPAGEVCALCVSFANLEASNVAAVPAFAIATAAALPDAYPIMPVASACTDTERARGPPLAL